MAAIVKAMASPESGLEVRDRMWLKITIPNAFIGERAPWWDEGGVESGGAGQAKNQELPWATPWSWNQHQPHGSCEVRRAQVWWASQSSGSLALRLGCGGLAVPQRRRLH